MTFDEYKKIYAEFRSTDSIKRKEEIIEEIKTAFTELNERIGRKCDELGIDLEKLRFPPFYTKLCGDIYIDDEDDYYDISESRVSLMCEEYYGRGGYDKYGTTVLTECLDEDGFNKFIGKIVESYVSVLKGDNAKLKYQIEELNSKIEKNAAEIQRLASKIGEVENA